MPQFERIAIQLMRNFYHQCQQQQRKMTAVASAVATAFCVKSFFLRKAALCTVNSFCAPFRSANILNFLSADYFYHQQTKRRNLINFMMKSITSSYLCNIVCTSH